MPTSLETCASAFNFAILTLLDLCSSHHAWPLPFLPLWLCAVLPGRSTAAIAVACCIHVTFYVHVHGCNIFQIAMTALLAQHTLTPGVLDVGMRCLQEASAGTEHQLARLPPAWRSAHMDVVKFMVSATSENKLYEAAWRSGSKLLREYGLMMKREHHIDVRNLSALLFLYN